jgi:hypothetical protein
VSASALLYGEPVRISLAAVLLVPALASADEPKWRDDGSVGGMRVELREVTGSEFEEIRVTTTSVYPLERLCEVIFGKGAPAQDEGSFKKREVIKETATERWTYEQISLPLVSDRDYVLHVKIEQPPDTGRCEISFQSYEDPAYPPTSDHVRMASVRGYWTLTPTEDGEVKIVYEVFSDPGGSVPAFLSRGSQRDAAVDFLGTILKRAAR